MFSTAKLLKALNTPLAIWALSTVVVGLFGFLYSQLSESLSIRRENALAIERLQLQLGARFYHSLPLLRQASDQKQYTLALDALLNDAPSTRLYADFRERSTASLVWEAAQRRKTGRNVSEGDAILFRSLANLAVLKSRLEQSSDTLEQRSIMEKIRATVNADPVFFQMSPVRDPLQ